MLSMLQLGRACSITSPATDTHYYIPWTTAETVHIYTDALVIPQFTVTGCSFATNQANYQVWYSTDGTTYTIDDNSIDVNAIHSSFITQRVDGTYRKFTYNINTGAAENQGKVFAKVYDSANNLNLPFVITLLSSS